MGIAKDVATSTLNKVGGNLEAAINHIFLDTPDTQEREAISTSDLLTAQKTISSNNYNNDNSNSSFDSDSQATSCHIELSRKNSRKVNSNTSNLPSNTFIISGGSNSNNILSRENLSENSSDSSIDSKEEYQPLYLTDTQPPTYQDFTMTSNDNSQQIFVPPVYSKGTYKVQKSLPDDPTVLLSLEPSKLLSNYFGLFSMSLALFAPDLFMGPDFVNLNFNDNWNKGLQIDTPEYEVKYTHNLEPGLEDRIEIVNAINLSEKERELTYQPYILWQLQKVISIMNSQISSRAYISSGIYSLCLDDNTQKKLMETSHLYDILPTFIRSLMNDCKHVPDLDQNRMKNMFVSKAFHQIPIHKEPTKVSLFLFHFLPEEYDSNLYKMFNSLLYRSYDEPIYPRTNQNSADSSSSDDEISNEEESSLDEISTILTVIFDELDQDTELITQPDGVEIPFEFYPELYTKKCKEKLINGILHTRYQNKLKMKEVLNDLNSLKSFEGKDILRFLNSTLEYLQRDGKEGPMVNKLSYVKEQLSRAKTEKMLEYKTISRSLQNEWNIDKPELSIIEQAQDLGLIGDPHLLVMAVLSPYLYFFRDRRNRWFKFQSSIMGTDFEITKYESDKTVQDEIKLNTKSASETPIMFVYCKKDAIPNDSLVLQKFAKNQGCSAFAQADEMSLKKNVTR
ncbi:hypothetical protein TBLA_0A02540 [Henningerozyma blattae CBS 6284]|uniref:UBA domain-containing protein n=1 Tax=Henningerozyma blattae (strain ATCC 34711 / CBS 6284 / DSM 70876 / NBRC 10599 / NRRL Y-10934 / UCD 77-7) TaxID=1071380 RepID=I2GVA1_HENB6|nr:hypothetical protein TBLA_0A02540 [Tetrapisispora blattae CBS 6284]CCH58053.1 hypothetical protein TBLA_0A02540 [Tetrapisispora blattae CBS 6284]